MLLAMSKRAITIHREQVIDTKQFQVNVKHWASRKVKCYFPPFRTFHIIIYFDLS